MAIYTKTFHLLFAPFVPPILFGTYTPIDYLLSVPGFSDGRRLCHPVACS